MKKILAGLGVLICAVLVITGAKASSVVSYTLYVPKGSTESTDSFRADYNQNYAVVNYLSVENGDTFDMYLQAFKGTSGYVNISNKVTVDASSSSGKYVYYKGSDAVGPSDQNFVFNCNNTFASSSSQCIISENSYRMQFYNGSWFGKTVAITGLFYGSDR